ncbi:MAG: hydrogenase maturation protease [Opitutaceae bacterium]|jgi:hydrogenase maturation protease
MIEPRIKVLVLGLGNDILTDDAVGLHIAREVARRLTGEPGIAVRETMEMGLALLDEIVGCESLVLVDSIQTGKAPPGHIHEIDAAGLSLIATPSPHFLGIGETLKLGHLLGLSMPKHVEIFAIEVADPFTLGTSLTPDVEGTVQRAAEQVTARARALAENPTPIHQPCVVTVQSEP